MVLSPFLRNSPTPTAVAAIIRNIIIKTFLFKITPYEGLAMASRNANLVFSPIRSHPECVLFLMHVNHSHIPSSLYHLSLWDSSGNLE